jgi:2-haloacid dehalogenase
MRYEWVLFDADGTLFDYDAAETKALKTTFEQFAHRFEPRHLEVYQQVNGQIWREFERGEIDIPRIKTERFARFFAAVGLNADPVTFSARYLVNLGHCADLIPGAVEIVQALYGQVGLAVITNGLEDVQRSRFARSPMGRYFSGIVISEAVGASKPDGAIFDAAFSVMGHPQKGQVLIVGDSLTSDMAGGSAYGIDTCWFNPSGRPRGLDVTICYEIHRLSELLDIVRHRS